MSAWLVKSEPDVYSIDQLKRDRKTHWHGVRNYQARNFLKAMEKGDQVLFYHSNCERPGIVGIAEVIKTAYPDPSQFDRSSEYYDKAATEDAPRWFCPDLAFCEKFPGTVTLEQLKEIRSLADFQLIKRGNRLSVLPVTASQFKTINTLAREASKK